MPQNYSYHESNVKLLVSGIIVLMFFLCVFGLLVLNLRTQESLAGLRQDLTQLKKPVTTTTSAVVNTEVTSTQDEYTYRVENQWDGNQKLVRMNDRTGQKETLVDLKPNVFSLSDSIFSVNIRSRIDNSFLVLQLGFEMDAPLPVDNFWLYNIETKEIKKMNTSMGPYGVFSPDGKYYVYPVLHKDYSLDNPNTRESRQFVALDILNDSSKVILNLPANETLIAKIEEFRGVPNFLFEFIDKNTIEYQVYEPSDIIDLYRQSKGQRLVNL